MTQSQLDVVINYQLDLSDTLNDGPTWLNDGPDWLNNGPDWLKNGPDWLNVRPTNDFSTF